MINSLTHYGVPGMKWGVRKNGANSSYITRYKTGNLNKFGTDGHNALFVTGLSGSGKSTFSINLANKTNSEVIHLDTYFEKNGVGNNKSFNKFLEDNQITKATMFNDGKLDYSVSDKILPLIKKYKKKVIVEGVQILDTTLSENARNIFMNEPIISLQTSKKIAINRLMNRDKISEDNIDDIISGIEETYKIKTDMEKDLNLVIGKYYADQML